MARKPPGPQAVATNRLEELVIVDREPGGTGSGVVRPMPPGGCRPGVHRILTRGGVVTVERGVSRRLAAQGVRQAAELGAEFFAEAEGAVDVSWAVTLWRSAAGDRVRDALYVYHRHGYNDGLAVPGGLTHACVGVARVPLEEISGLRILWANGEKGPGCCRCCSPGGGLLAVTPGRVRRLHFAPRGPAPPRLRLGRSSPDPLEVRAVACAHPRGWALRTTVRIHAAGVSPDWRTRPPVTPAGSGAFPVPASTGRAGQSPV